MTCVTYRIENLPEELESDFLALPAATDISGPGRVSAYGNHRLWHHVSAWAAATTGEFVLEEYYDYCVYCYRYRDGEVVEQWDIEEDIPEELQAQWDREEEEAVRLWNVD